MAAEVLVAVAWLTIVPGRLEAGFVSIGRHAGSILSKRPSTTAFAGGCNRGFGELASDFDFLAFLNPDVVVEKDCLQRCVEVLEDLRGSGGCGAAAHADRTVGPSTVWARCSKERISRSGTAVLVPNRAPRSWSPGRCSPPVVLWRYFAPRRYGRLPTPHGPWAQHYFCFWEDLEIGWRLANNGWRIETCPDAVATHRRGAGAAEGRGPLRWRRPPELEACILTNRWMTLIRHLHPLDLAPRLPLLLVWDVGMAKAGMVRRPSLIRHLKSRWPLVVSEWRGRHRFPKRRLRELT